MRACSNVLESRIVMRLRVLVRVSVAFMLVAAAGFLARLVSFCFAFKRLALVDCSVLCAFPLFTVTQQAGPQFKRLFWEAFRIAEVTICLFSEGARDHGILL